MQARRAGDAAHERRRKAGKTAVAAIVVAGLVPAAWLAAPALSLGPYVPRAVDFELRDTTLTVERAGRVHAGGVRLRLLRSRVLEAPKRFNLVGLRWRGATSARILMRVRRDGGAWSAWTRVPASRDHMPDRGSGEGRAGWTASDPLWAGEADQLQYRIAAAGPVRDVRLHFVNSKGTATALDRLRSSLRRAAADAVATVVSLVGDGAAGADTSMPEIVTRGQWGASQCPPRAAPAYGSVKLAFVHHTVTANDYSPEDSPSIVLAICRYHRNSNRWNDIGYNFLVDRYGAVFEGRAGGMDQAVIGAQAQGYNSQSSGVANLGTFSTVGQTGEGLEALARLLSWKLAIHGVPPTGTAVVRSSGGPLNRYPAGTDVQLERISGHRDGDATACPGDGLYAQLPRLRRMVEGDPRAATRVVLQATRGRITYGGSAELDGSLQTADGSPLPGQPVQIKLLGEGGRPTVAQASTDSAGLFQTQVRFARNRTVQARFSGAAGLQSAQSVPVGIAVRPLITAGFDRGRKGSVGLRVGDRAHINGAVRPRKRLALLVVYRRGDDGQSARIARVALRTRSGRIRASYRLRRRGVYRMRIFVKPDGRNLGARSDALQVRVS